MPPFKYLNTLLRDECEVKVQKLGGGRRGWDFILNLNTEPEFIHLMASAKQYKQIGEEIWKTKTERIVRFRRYVRRYVLPSGLRYPSQNAELFTMAYGALVIQLIQDYEDYTEVNKQLEKM